LRDVAPRSAGQNGRHAPDRARQRSAAQRMRTFPARTPVKLRSHLVC
jgi:hypothetical protein